jgi:alpha 1,3-glucosidase
MYPRSKTPRSVSIDTPLSSFPLLLQGGHIIPIRQRVRRSSPLMWQDPFTLIISLSKEGTASGKLYLDDGVGYDYEKGEYILRQYDYSSGTLRSTAKSSPSIAGNSVNTYDPRNNWAQAIGHVRVERIVILGLKAEPKSIKVGGNEVEYTWEKGLASDSKKGGMGSRLTLKNPGVYVVEDWEITLS